MKALCQLLLLLLCLFAVLFTSCAPSANTPAGRQEEEAEDTRQALAAVMDALREEYQKADAEKQDQIDELRQRLEALSPSETPKDPQQMPSGQYRYEAVEGGIMLVAYLGRDVHAVVPYAIDGMRVMGIGSYAFRDTGVESVIVCEGVSYLEWFAFGGCPKLSSIVLPASVERIGYGALDGCASDLTVHAPEGSFAASFCKSFGIACA